jgi:hypothetical protein
MAVGGNAPTAVAFHCQKHVRLKQQQHVVYVVDIRP